MVVMLALALGCGTATLPPDQAAMVEAVAVARQQPELAVSLVLGMEDPVVRSATLHHLALDPTVQFTLEQTERLCATAPTDPGRQACLTRFNASHLAPFYGTAPPDPPDPPRPQ